MSDLKKELRRSILDLRAGLEEQTRRRKSESVCANLIEELEKIPSLMRREKSLFTFMPFGHEADIFPVAEWSWSCGIPVVAPKTLKEPRKLQLFLVEGRHQLVPGVWGIPEPSPAASPADPGEIGAVIVPGVVFDKTGGRLGYGGGYYDRFFASLREQGVYPLKLAPAFDLQLVEQVPMERHDERVDVIVTETARYETGAITDRRDR